MTSNKSFGKMDGVDKRYRIVALTLAALLAGFVSGFYGRDFKKTAPLAGNQPVINQDLGKPSGVDFSQFWDVWKNLHDKYVDKQNLDTQALVYGAIDGMVKAVGDPYTTFFKPDESRNFNEEIRGSFSGIGIEIGVRDNILTVIAPIKGTPAEKAGLMAGDKILKIGQKATDNIKLQDAVSMIKGPKGTPVVLGYSREGLKDPREVTIIRDTIKIPAVDYKTLDKDVAYIQLFAFNKNIDSEFKKTADAIVKSDSKKIILDLRNNPGGLLDSAVNIASFFLDRDNIVTTEKFGNGTQNVFRSQPNGELKDYPLVVLINKGSASASEILAGALKDNRHITLVGEKSFGKGSVQEIDDVGGQASLKVTIAKWYTPNDLSINSNGIAPDISASISEDDIKNNKDPQLDKALEIVKNLN